MRLAGLIAFSSVTLLALGCSVSTTDNSITFKTQTRFLNDPDVTKESTKAWDGEAITIVQDGAAIIQNGGLQIVGSPTATKVSVTARVIALADKEDKANADKSIADVVASVKIVEEAGRITVQCKNGGTYGTSSAGKSGCELLTVTVPSGSEQKPHNLTAGCGNGTINVSGIVGAALIEGNGTGDIVASITPTKGVTVQVTQKQAGDVTLSLPANFATDSLVIRADAASISIDPGFTPAVENNKGRGTAGTGAAAINVTSTEFAGSTGKVTLAKQ
jgi:hypothetical protein